LMQLQPVFSAALGVPRVHFQHWYMSSSDISYLSGSVISFNIFHLSGSILTCKYISVWTSPSGSIWQCTRFYDSCCSPSSSQSLWPFHIWLERVCCGARWRTKSEHWNSSTTIKFKLYGYCWIREISLVFAVGISVAIAPVCQMSNKFSEMVVLALIVPGPFNI
jgi:hypothetical protein